jgi:hypothetical protein
MMNRHVIDPGRSESSRCPMGTRGRGTIVAVIERLADMPSATVGFRAAGEIEREDYDEVLVPELHRALETGGGLRTLYLIEDLEEIDRARRVVGRFQARVRRRCPAPRGVDSLGGRH